MTMPYKVRDRASSSSGSTPGDLINATLVIVSNDAYLTDVKKVGEAPLEQAPPDAAAGVVGLRAAEAGRAGARRARSSIRTAASGRSASFKGSPVVDDVHLHASARCRRSVR